ncbi:MAG: BRCT domain-containing protein, partial [Planctomycetes bacterium]|nr:BRCT domain-containing protein [Planctomycetota bacterium]
MSSTSDRTREQTQRHDTAAPRSSLEGHEVVLTGRLASMDREEASQHIERAGGRLAQRPTETTQLVVVGAFGWPLARDGQPTRTLLEARELQKRGVPIVIAPEEDFLVALGMDELQQGL